MNSAVLDVSPGLMTMRSLPVLNAFAYGRLRFHRHAGRMLDGRETGAGAHLERGDGLVAAHTHLLAVRTVGNTAVTVPSSACSRSVQASSNGCSVSSVSLRRSYLVPSTGSVPGRNEVLVDGDMRAPRHGQAALGVVGVDLIAVSVEAVGEPRVDGQGPRCVWHRRCCRR